MVETAAVAWDPTEDELFQEGGESGEDEARKYLTFMQGDECYGVDIERVREIIEYGAVTAVPMAPQYIRGVINLRGHVVPIVDIGRRLGVESADVNARACNIIVEMTVDSERVPLGFTVQSVEEVVDIRDAEIEAAPAFGTDVPAEYIAGMGKIEGRFVTILDINKALAVDALAQFPERRAAEAIERANRLGERSDLLPSAE